MSRPPYGLARQRAPQSVVGVSEGKMRWIGEMDRLLAGHGRRVEGLARRLGAQMGVRGGQLDELAASAHLHDIGKLAIPRHVIHLPRALTEREQRAMATHPERGYRMLIDRVPTRIADAVRAHHEWYDGRGYPYGMYGREVPLYARIISVVDTYDAITSHRSYDPARTFEEARLEITTGAGTQFDPTVVDAFLSEFALEAAQAA